MLNQIFAHTPRWVWVLLLALLCLGLSQSVTRRASLRRVTLLPLVMAGLSLYGAVSGFGAQAPLLFWLASAAASAALVLRRGLPEGTRYDALRLEFTLPGSWMPMALVLGIFLTKYFVGVVTALQPALVGDPLFAFTLSALYGAFSGVFLARALRLWRLAARMPAVRPPQPPVAA